MGHAKEVFRRIIATVCRLTEQTFTENSVKTLGKTVRVDLNSVYPYEQNKIFQILSRLNEPKKMTVEDEKKVHSVPYKSRYCTIVELYN